jgi:hypothetical protein
VIPALKRLRQENHEFKASLSYTMWLSQNKKKEREREREMTGYDGSHL